MRHVIVLGPKIVVMLDKFETTYPNVKTQITKA